MSESVKCSFCGRIGEHAVGGPGVFICAECVELCVEILGEPDVSPPEPDDPVAAERRELLIAMMAARRDLYQAVRAEPPESQPTVQRLRDTQRDAMSKLKKFDEAHPGVRKDTVWPIKRPVKYSPY